MTRHRQTKGLGWAVVLGIVGFILIQTFTLANQHCNSSSVRDDVDLGWCYAVLVRDKGNAVAQVIDTMNFDIMRLTGQHHTWGR